MKRFFNLSMAIAASMFFIACGGNPDMKMFDELTNNGKTDQVTVVDQPSTATPTDIPATATPVVCEDKDGDKFCVPVDCNDNDPNVHPGVTEVCNGKDDDCDGKTDPDMTETLYVDKDHDGYGLSSEATILCISETLPKDYAVHGGDCNDSTDDTNNDGVFDGHNINPTSTEICGDNIDNNCDGQIDESCAPPKSSTPKVKFQVPYTPNDVYIMVVWPNDKLGQSLSTQTVTDLSMIGDTWDQEITSQTNVVTAKIDTSALLTRFNTAHGGKEWLCMDGGIRKDAQVLLVSDGYFQVDITTYLDVWPVGTDGSCSAEFVTNEVTCGGE